jgi:hypothetical protein
LKKEKPYLPQEVFLHLIGTQVGLAALISAYLRKSAAKSSSEVDRYMPARRDP